MANEHTTLNWFEITVAKLDASAKLYSAMLETELERAQFFAVPHAIFPAEDPAMTGALVHDPKGPTGHGRSGAKPVVAPGDRAVRHDRDRRGSRRQPRRAPRSRVS